MIFVTKKQLKKEKAFMYGAAGAAGVFGATGTTLGAIALAKVCKVSREMENFQTDMERRMAAEEGMTNQFVKAVTQMQDVLEDNNMLREKRKM